MWKKFLLYSLFMAICFMVPCLFIEINAINNKKNMLEMNNVGSGESSINEDKTVIKLLLSESNQVVELSMNDYIKGVLLRRNACNV